MEGTIFSNRLPILSPTCVVVHSTDAILSKSHILKLRKIIYSMSFFSEKNEANTDNFTNEHKRILGSL